MSASRARSASLSQGLADVPLAGDQTVGESQPKPIVANARAAPVVPATVWSDLKSFRWTTNPATSLKLITATVALWGALEALPLASNPLSHALFISYPLAGEPGDDVTRYGKGLLDLAFLAFYIVVWSFVRQAVTEFTLRPLAAWAGLKSDAKQVRARSVAPALTS